MADVPMPEGFTETADEQMPEGFTEVQVADPQPVDASLPPSGSSSPAPSNEVVGFTAQDISTEVEKDRTAQLADEKAAQWNRLNAAFASPLFTENTGEAALSISKRLGIPFETVRANLKEFKATAEEAEFNPDLWVERNPRLAKVLNKHHELAPMALRSKTLGDLVTKYEQAVSWVTEKADLLSPEDIAEQNKQAKVMGEGDDAAIAALNIDQSDQRTRVRRELDDAARTAPKAALETDDALAKIIREKSGLDYLNAVAWQRTIEGMAQNKRALNYEELGRARFMEEHGMTPARSSLDIEVELHDEQLKHPTRAFGDDSGLPRLVGVAAQGVSSTLGAGQAGLEAGGKGYAAAAAVFGGATLAITKSPVAAAEVGHAAGQMVGGKTAGAAAMLQMYRYETGASYERNLGVRTEAGQLLTNDEAMGGAVLEGLFKSALEGFSFSKQAQVFKGALPGAVRAALTRDPTFRALLGHVAKEYFESIATETVTEGLQQGVEQVGEYLTKSAADGAFQKGPIFKPGELISASEGGLAGAVVLGIVPSAITITTTPTVKKASALALERTADARAEKADQAVGPILDMAADPLVKAAPDHFAEMIKDSSGEHGAPLESLHVDAQAVRAYFQKDGAAVQDQELIDSTGDESAPQRLRDALESGGKLEIPIQQVLATWGASELGKAMREHTSTSATALSPKQREEQKTAIKQQAKQVEEEIGAELTQEEELDAEREKIEQSVTEQRGPKEGKRIGLMFAHFWRSSASDFKNETPANIAQTFLTRFFAGDNLPSDQTGRTEASLVDPGEGGDAMPRVGEDAGAAVLEAANEMTHEERGRALFVDKSSGLRSARAWDMTPRTPGKEVLVLTTADMKAINDDPSGGHDTTNDLLRAIGREVVKFDPRAALAGPDFRLEVDPGKAEEVRAAVQAALPPGIVLDAGVGATAEEASKAAGASVDAKRASGEYGKRGSTKFDTKPLAAPGFRFSSETDAHNGAVSDDLQAHVASGDATPGRFEDTAAFIKEAMYDHRMPGVLSKTGFDAVGERDHVIAFDGIGLKDLNDTLGKEAGNVYLAIIASVARDLGGEGLFFAHLSGDEYAAKADDRAVLESFARDLQDELRQVIVEWKHEDGREFLITPAVRHGIGEKTYGNADRALNAAKRTEAERGVARKSAFGQRVGDSSQLPGRGDLEALGRRADARRGEQTDAVAARAQGDAEFDPEALSPGSTREPSKSQHSPEQMAEARTAVDRMRTGNRLRFTRFLDFVEGWANGAERPTGMITRAEERRFAKEFGIVDPETGFAVNPGVDAGKNENAGRKKTSEKTTAGKERQRAAREQFEKNVLGRVNQKDEEKNLLVQHNLTEGALRHASKMGGFAAPSLAVARKEYPLENFGEVTLLGNPDLVDPDKGARTFDADVYSPRYPDTRFKLKGKELRELEAKLVPFAKTTESYLGELHEKIADEGEAAATASRSIRPAFELAWLTEKGLAPEIPYKKPEPAYPGVIDAAPVREFFKKQLEEHSSIHVERDGEAHAEISKLVKEAVANSDEETTGARDYTDNWFEENGLLRTGILDRLAQEARKLSTEEKGDKVDKYKLEDLLQEAVDKAGRPEFEKWTAEQVKPVLGDSYIRKFTSTGDERKIAHTIENVLKEMIRELRAGENFNYGLGTARSLGAEEFKSMKAVQKARDRIIPSKDFEPMKKAMDEKFANLVTELDDATNGSTGMRSFEAVAEAIGQSYRRGKSLRKELELSGFKSLPAALVQKVAKFAEELVKMPTEYFETKPQRVVQVQEFEAAVVPSNASKETRDVLKKHGLEVVEYDAKTEGARAKAIADTSEKLKILFQPGDGETTTKPGANDPSVPKGYTLMPNAAQGRRLFDVFLNAKADASTAIHEAAHVFLEIMGELAARPDAGDRTRQKWLDTLKWMGTTEEKWAKLNAEDRTALHERFAEAFEVYASEGSAPSLSLEGTFVRFRDWVLEVFRTLKAQRAPINNDIRSVFDRMLATDDEIKRHLGKRGRPLFDNAKDAGMTDSQWADKLEADAEDRNFANRKVWLRAVREQLREKDAIWKEELHTERAAAEKRFEKLPAVIAQQVLDGTLAGTDAVLLDRKQVIDAVGRKDSRRFRTAVTGGRNIDEVGIAAQFPNGKAMLAAVVALPSRDEWVEAEADASMKKKHGDLLTDRTALQKDVAGGLHDFVEKQQLEEWAALNRGLKPGMGRPVVPAEAIREAAGNMINRRAVKSLNGARVLQAERTAATAKAEHAVKGEIDMATAAAKRQLLNSYLYRETLKALDEKEELEDLAKRLGKTSGQAKLGKASKEYRDAVSFILESLGLKTPTGVTSDGVRGRSVIERAIAEMNGAGFAIGDPEWKAGIDGVLSGTSEFRTGDRMAALELGNLTVRGMRAVKDALKSLAAAANDRNTTLRDGKRVDIEQSEAAIIANIESTKSKKRAPVTRESETSTEKLKNFLSGVDGFLRNPIDKARELVDDDQESELFKVLINPVRAAKYREAALIEKVIHPLTQTMERIPAAMKKTLRDPIEQTLFADHTKDFTPPRYRHELLVMALNYGNESNAQRLRDGRNITDDEIVKALNLLTKEELAWVQQVFDAAEKLRPEAFALEERLTGLPVKAIKARPVTLTNGTLLGGYFPAVYERGASSAGEKQNAAQVLDPNYTRVGTPHGNLKARADKVSAVISLSVGNVYRGLAQTAHDIAFREALLSAAAMVLRPKVQTALKGRLGPGGAEYFLRWYKDIGGAQQGPRNEHEKAVAWIRGNMAPALLGFKPGTALGDFANLLAAVPSTKLKMHHLSSAVNAYLESPRELRKLALEKSAELRFMSDETRKQYNEQLREFTKRGMLERGPAPVKAAGRAISQVGDWLKDNSFVFMEAVAKMTATPVWLGAYKQALTEGKPEGEAVRWANDILTQVFPSHSAVEQSALLRNKGYVGLSTVFGGYLNTVYRSNARIASPLFTTAFEHADLKEKSMTIGQVGASLLAFTVAWQIFGELFMAKGAEAGDDDDEDPSNKALRWRNWAARKLVTGPIQTLPLVSEVSSTVDSIMTGRQAHGRGGVVAEFVLALGKGLADVYDAKGEKTELDRLEAIWKILGATKGMPQGMNKSLRYLLETSMGDRVVPNPGRFVGGAIYGEGNNSPDNVPQTAGDALTE